MLTHHRNERGQVLVMVAASMLILLGIAALVIDLGFSWMLARHQQNIVDPASLAAAKWIPTFRATGDATYGPAGPDSLSPPGLMWQEACAVARQNEMFADATDNTECTPENDGERAAALTVNYPPSASAGPYASREGVVQVVFSGQHPSFFGSILGSSTANVSRTAVAALVEDDALTAFSIRVLDPGDSCGAMKVSGEGGDETKVRVEGGILVNSTCGSPDNPSGMGICEISDTSALRTDGGGAIEAQADIYVAGSCKGDPTSLTGPGQLIEGATRLPDPYTELRPPRFDEHPPGSCNGVTPLTPASTGCVFNSPTPYTLQPGIYYGGWRVQGPNTQLRLTPGIYIIAGGGIRQTGGTIESIADPTTGDPAEVLIYSTDNIEQPAQYAACQASWTNSAVCQGGINLNGKNLLLSGLTSGRLKGMLLWQDERGSCPTDTPACNVQVGGQESLEIAGTIYVPDQELILDGGSSGTGTATVQIMTWHLTITGGSELVLPYDADELLDQKLRGLVR